ncbi:MAG: xanthine dehydrogenase family protein molybdopterin-binding subunit [Spirochaetota bacterium]
MNGGELKIVGKKVPKIDGVELVTGKAQFTGDLSFPGMLYGYARRAGVAAGKIKKIDVSPAFEVPGVRTVLLFSDIPGPNIIGILPPYDQPLLARDEIRYEGESLALVVAESKAAAKKGARAITVAIEPLKPILEMDEALREDARKIHPQGNITYSRKLMKGNVEEGFREADIIIENTYATSFQEHAYLEPEAVCALPTGDGRITVYASCQSPFHIRGHIAANLNVPASFVKVIQAYTGGSFGGKDDVATETGALAAIAALKLGKPVMIAHERDESIIGSTLRHASRIYYKTGAKKDGTIVAKQVRILLDGGAYASESPFVTMKALIHAAGPYNIPHIFIECTTVYTNKTYCGAFRGFGVPQVTFASESQMDELAERLRMDPLKIRLKNGLRAGEKTATGQVYPQSVGLIETINRVKENSKDYFSTVKIEPNDRYLYGTGFASMLQGISNGAEGVDVVGASVQVSLDGSAIVGVGLTELGQGSRTVYAQIASEILGIGLDKIAVKPVDTDAVHDSGPTVASRSTTVGGMAVQLAALEVKKSLVKMASLMFKTNEDLIILKDNLAVLKGDENARIPLREVSTAAYWTGFPLMNLSFSKAPDAAYDHETHQGNIYIAYNFGTHMMHIRIDKNTGQVEVLKHLACHDVGKVINPLGLQGQVEGAALMGFGLAHLEKIVHREGRIINPNFADYAVPTIMDRIPTETLVVEDYNPTGPYGAKGVGDPPVAGTAAAFANAVSNALNHRFTRLPITREDILKLLKGSVSLKSQEG